MASPLLLASPAVGFDEAARIVLEHLHDRLGFDLWAITRVEGEDWIVLDARDDGYDICAGDVYCWPDTLCSRMVRGFGPCIAPDARTVEAYAEAPMANQLEIGAYIGMPIAWTNGMLFGTLCAFDPRPAPEIVERELPLVQLLARLLGTIVAAEARDHEASRRAERAELAEHRDALTSVGDRRSWDRALGLEERRCTVLADTASVIVVDLDGLAATNERDSREEGDRLLVRTAQALTLAARPDDVVARISDDRFGMLLPECRAGSAARVVERVREALATASIQASVGMSTRGSQETLQTASLRAAENMLAEKDALSAGRAPSDAAA